MTPGKRRSKPDKPVSNHLTAPYVAHGWKLYFHPLFLDQYEALIKEVESLKQRDPDGYKRKNPAKRLAAITDLVFDRVPQDPSRPEYRQGSTLGDKYKHWFRAKFFQRYRLFFRYHTPSKTILFAWVNDEDALRTYGSDSDAYRVFGDMLQDGEPPDDWNTLLEACAQASGRAKRLTPKAP